MTKQIAFDSSRIRSRLIKAMFLFAALGYVVLYSKSLKEGSTNSFTNKRFKEEPRLLEQSTNPFIKKQFKEKPRLLEPLASKTLGPAGSSSPKDELERIWNYIYNRQYDCTKSEYLGGRKTKYIGDGAYSLCTEEQFWPADYDPNYKCLVYLFGVGGDFSFDDEMAKKGCEVHSFDPSEKYQDGWVRDSGVVFHKIGISNEDTDSGKKGWKLRTLKTLIKELGHGDRHLDVLKVDTDGTGVELVLQHLLDTGLYKCVRQFSMEVHMYNPLLFHAVTRCRYLHKLMVDLNTVGGWRLYNTTDNVRFIKDSTYTQRTSKAKMLNGENIALLFETSFVNFDVEGHCGDYL